MQEEPSSQAKQRCSHHCSNSLSGSRDCVPYLLCVAFLKEPRKAGEGQPVKAVKPQTSRTMSAPFHVLMLPGSKVPGASAADNGRDRETTGTADGEDGANRDPLSVDTSSSPAPLGAEAAGTCSTAVPNRVPSPPPPEVTIPEDDYLLTRHRHRVSSVQDASSDDGSTSRNKSKTNAKAKGSGGDNDVDDDDDTQKAVPVCTPIEIAIINCCDCGTLKKRKVRKMSLSQEADEERSGGTDEVRRPTDDEYDGSSSPMEEDGSVDGNSSVEYSTAAASSGIDGGDESNAKSEGDQQLAGSSALSFQLSLPAQMGHLAKGKEGKFAALIAQHCHTVSDRALALAVLERTMEHDKAMAAAKEKDFISSIGKKRKREECSTESVEKDISGDKKSSEDSNASNVSSGMEGIVDEKPKASLGTAVSRGDRCNGETDDASSSRVNVSRMANFLSAGGLKILCQWLVDSFTPIQKPVSQSPSKKGKDSGNKRRRQKESTEVETKPEISPTGPLILPLLSILQSIPFQYDLVKECKINKQVKKLKKSVERVIGADSSKKSAIEKKLRAMKVGCSHPNSGGMPVIEVYRQIEKLIDAWIKAMNEEKKRSESVEQGRTDNSSESGKQRHIVYQSLHAKMSERLEALSKYEAGKAPQPSWLAKLDPKASAGKGKGINAEEAARQRQMKEKAAASAKAAKEKAEHDKRLLEAKRRKLQLQEELNAENAAIEENKKRLEQYRRRLQEESEQRRTATGEAEKPGQKDKSKGRRLRKVTWADQYSGNTTKLAEIREFVQEEDHPSEEDARRRSESDSTPEEDEYDYDEETQASDSVEEDEFDEDPNLS